MTEQPARLVETHTAVVVFLGHRVIKVKKPVRLPFLDFSTREARRRACEDEVALNRRLAPDVYLGVGALVDPDGEAEAVVVMRRMPDERRLAALVARGADVDDHVRQLARLLAAFHASAATSPQIDRAGDPATVRGLWEASFAQVAAYVGRILDPGTEARTEELVRRYLSGREPLLRWRVQRGQMRDGHGDLLADDVFCLDDGPRVLDCIEFDPGLRHGDVLADIAFLAMDLERLGAPDAAAALLRAYAEFSAETHPESLAHLYVAYRAHVRAKVTCLRSDQGEPSAAAEARPLAALALRHLEAGRCRLVLVGGLPGTGKSTLAEGIADRLGWLLVRSDVLRKQLAGLPDRARAGAAYRHGIYTAETTARTYQEMIDRARRALRLGESVVLDASWTDDRWRLLAAHAAETTASELVELRCDAPPEVTAERLALRAAAGLDPSDAGPDVAARMATDADPWPSAYVVDTTPGAGLVIDCVVHHLLAAPALDPRPQLVPG
jgi:aminoglycoside phosphotransferase family enzyme/predicted kinase